MGVGDIVREVKTIFTADLAALKAASAQAAGDFDKVGAAAERAQVKTRDTWVKVQSGFTNSAGPNAFTRGEFGGRREGMASDSMLAELERLRAAAVKAKPAVAELGAAAKEATAAAAGGFSGFKDGIQGTLGPLKFLRENLAFVGLGVFGVIEGIASVIEYLDRASPATLEWGKSLKTLGQDYRAFREFVREQEIRRGNITPDAEPVRAIKEARQQIFGGEADPEDPSGTKNAGFWQKAADREKAAIDNYEETVRVARSRGFKVSKEGQLELDKSSLTPTQQLAMRRDQDYVTKALEEQRMLARDLKRAFDSMGFATKQRVDVEKENARLLWEQSLAAADLLGKLDNIRNVGSIVVEGVGKSISDFANQVGQGAAANFANLKTDKERKEDFGKGFAKLLGIDLKKGKTGVHVDARGSKISVSAPITTDDPARFANVAVKSAFLATIAAPLSATMGLGSPMVGGSR